MTQPFQDVCCLDGMKDQLAAALVDARRCEIASPRGCQVARDDIEKAEAAPEVQLYNRPEGLSSPLSLQTCVRFRLAKVRLDELHNMSPEQRAAKQAARFLREQKKEATQEVEEREGGKLKTT
eukprot:5725816-Amphidinium_carterae.1